MPLNSHSLFNWGINFFSRSIEELQEQNQKLLVILRDVSEEKEQAEADASQEQ